MFSPLNFGLPSEFGLPIFDDDDDVASTGTGVGGGVGVGIGVKKRSRSRAPQICIRIDGELICGTYAEIAHLIELQAQRDAADQEARSRTEAKKQARKAAQTLRERLTIETPMPYEGVDMSIVADQMFRDLRDVYTQQIIASMVNAHLSRQAYIQQRRRAEDEAAMRAAEELLMS